MDPSPRRPTLLHICLQGRPRSSSALPAALTPAHTTLTGRVPHSRAARAQHRRADVRCSARCYARQKCSRSKRSILKHTVFTELYGRAEV